jgi:hypothetical protein
MYNLQSAAAAVQLRLSGDTFISLENWRRSQPKIPARSEAVRRLVEIALNKLVPGVSEPSPTTGEACHESQ